MTTVFPLRYSHTFTHTLLRADLLAIFHRMQGEIYLWDRLLVLHGALSDLEVVPRYVDVHLGELSQDQRVRIIQRTRSWATVGFAECHCERRLTAFTIRIATSDREEDGKGDDSPTALLSYLFHVWMARTDR